MLLLLWHYVSPVLILNVSLVSASESRRVLDDLLENWFPLVRPLHISSGCLRRFRFLLLLGDSQADC